MTAAGGATEEDVSIQNICNNCFTGTGGKNPCPQCGFDNLSSFNNSQQLQYGTVLNRQYLVGKTLGQGGFGITYLGYDLVNHNRIAIKEYFPSGLVIREGAQVQPILPENQAAFHRGVEAFFREARILAKLINFPNIVGVLNFFQEKGTAYFVMEYIEGQSLRGYLESRGGRISYEEALVLLRPIMASLDAVHQEGMLHRDIAPDNIYVTEAGETKLLDFGAARYHEEEDTHSIRTVIKPGYAPMEQYPSGSSQGPWTDVYGMGATFYRAITGIVPPDAPTRSLKDDLLPPSQLGVALPMEADHAIMRALALNIIFRFRSMTEFSNMLVRQDPIQTQMPPGPVSDRAQDTDRQPFTQQIRSEPITEVRLKLPEERRRI